ncbi:BRO-N domain-containing protein [Salinicola halophyticus]|uniref:BRO-N domain-containing protein n=1 Tax=Salinicola halophyticus TaxID=1808881 RepID=UPI003F469D93
MATQAATAVIPFQFDAQEVRALMIDEQPWFFAVDVCQSLALRDTNKALIGLDEDEKREHEQYSGSGRKPVLINESGLYSLILRSRKAEAKRFKKWVTAEVLPTIRKTGGYQAETIGGETIGTDGLKILRELIGKKVRVLPHSARNSAQHRLWNLLHTRFNVPKAEMIAANDMDAAANFVGQWAIEGEYLERARPPAEAMVINFPKRQKALDFTPTGLYGNEAWKNDLSLLMVELRHAARNGNTIRVENVEGPLEEMLALRHFLEIAEGGLSPRNRQLLAGKAIALECAFVQQVGPALKLLDSKLYGDMREHIGVLARYLRQGSSLSA